MKKVEIKQKAFLKINLSRTKNKAPGVCAKYLLGSTKVARNFCHYNFRPLEMHDIAISRKTKAKAYILL